MPQMAFSVRAACVTAVVAGVFFLAFAVMIVLRASVHKMSLLNARHFPAKGGGNGDGSEEIAFSCV